MKTLENLFELMAEAVTQTQNERTSKQWMISYAGHVNTIDISFYRMGWDLDATSDNLNHVHLDETGIQLAYWFIQSNL